MNSRHVQQPQGTLGRREWIDGWMVRRVLTYSRFWVEDQLRWNWVKIERFVTTNGISISSRQDACRPRYTQNFWRQEFDCGRSVGVEQSAVSLVTQPSAADNLNDDWQHFCSRITFSRCIVWLFAYLHLTNNFTYLLTFNLHKVVTEQCLTESWDDHVYVTSSLRTGGELH